MLGYLWRSKTGVAAVDDTPDFVEAGQSEAALALAASLPGSVFSEQSTRYHESVSSYYSQNCTSQRPGCIVRPRSTQEVSTALKTLRPFIDASFKKQESDATSRVQFAVRSGGHAFEHSMSNIDDGIVIDLSLIKTVDVADDCETTVIGTGNKWDNVYTKLDAMGLAVSGGRDSSVGVGGLTLGGGISYLSPLMGMVCDNIVDYEVVLADGTITHATATQNEDLWRALKGGSNNFGIVTHFTSKTVPFGKIWGGYFYWTAGQMKNLLRAFHEVNRPENFDPHAAGPILAFAYQSALGVKGCGGSIVYTKPEAWPAVWTPFRKIWRLWSTTGIRSLTSVAQEMHGLAPHGLRQAVFTTTIKNDLESILHFETLYHEAAEKVKHCYKLTFALTVQPLTRGIFTKGEPNVLGLEGRDPKDSFVIVLCCPGWTRAEDDETIIAASKALIEAGEKFAESRGAGERYRYLNYAAKEQNPLDGYGHENLEFMRQVSRKYDPDSIFQRAVPGGFKLGMY